MTIEVRPATTGDDDLATIARIISTARPDDPTTVDEMRWSDATYPGGRRFIATLDGGAVGVGTIGRIYVYPPTFDALWGTVDVLPGARRRGVGTAALEAIRAATVEVGKMALHIPASDGRPDGVAFLLHRGFTEYERAAMVELRLAGLARPQIEPPAGVRLVTLDARPDLVPGVHAVAQETFDDIPGDDPMAAGDLAEFRARDVDRDVIPRWGFLVAVADATDQVIGYASLAFDPGSSTVAYHDMTAVRPAWRGRGVATALKAATIAAARDHGLERLYTGNDIDNVPMRAVNARLGYRPLPDWLTMRGPAIPPGAADPIVPVSGGA